MKTKTFDCVEMKHKIQQKHLVLLKGLSPKEEIKVMEEAILKNPKFAKYIKSAKKS